MSLMWYTLEPTDTYIISKMLEFLDFGDIWRYNNLELIKICSTTNVNVCIKKRGC